MAGQISGIGVAFAATGGLLIYSGLYNQSVGTILRDVVSGKKPTPGPAETFAIPAGSSAGSSAATAGAPTPEAATATAAANQAIGKLLAVPYGWSVGQEWDSLVALWNRESGWSNTAFNASGAYGVAQALGHAASGDAEVGPRSVGSDTPGLNASYGGYGLSTAQAQAANAGHASPQIIWGLNYIKATYGDPIAAWAHEESAGWY